MNEKLAADLASLAIDRSKPKPTGRWVWVVASLVGLGALGLVADRYVRPAVSQRFNAVEITTTAVASVGPAAAASELTASGYVVPESIGRVSVRVVGRIAKVHVTEGAEVREGDLLFELDSSVEAATLAAARARVSAASARVATLVAQRAELELEQGRQVALVSAGAVPKGGLDDLNARIRSASAQIRAAEAEVNAISAEVRSQEVGIQNLKVFAPMAGQVMTKPASVGDVTTPGLALLELVDRASLIIESDVSESRLSQVKIGGPCEVVLDALPDVRLRGTVYAFGPRLNRSKATALVKVKLEKPPAELRPDMSARVNFLSKPLEDSALSAETKVVIPASALTTVQGERAVFVVDGTSVKLVPVTIGEPVQGGFELKVGPPVGTKLVKDPPASLTDGQTIREKQSSP